MSPVRGGGWTNSPRRAELPPNWRKIRTVILKRDGHRCTHIQDGQRCEAKATDVDHVNGRHNHAPSNLTSLCSPHHLAKTAAESVAARATARAARLRPAERHPGLRPE